MNGENISRIKAAKKYRSINVSLWGFPHNCITRYVKLKHFTVLKSNSTPLHNKLPNVCVMILMSFLAVEQTRDEFSAKV